MSVVAAIRKMLVAGFSVEQALIAAEIMEAEQPVGEQLTLRQARNRRYRDRLNASQTVSGVLGETIEDDKVPPSLAKERSPTPPKENSTLPPSKPAKRACALSPNWEPDGRDVAFASKRGGSSADISAEGERFKSHHIARGSLMKDWNMAWQTWWLSPIRARSTGPPRMNGHAVHDQPVLTLSEIPNYHDIQAQKRLLGIVDAD